MAKKVSGPRPKTPRLELHDEDIPGWRELAEAQGETLAEWVRRACREQAERERSWRT